MNMGANNHIPLVALWRDNREKCADLSAVLAAAQRRALKGVSPDYVEHVGFVVTDRRAALASIKAGSSLMRGAPS